MPQLYNYPSASEWNKNYEWMNFHVTMTRQNKTELSADLWDTLYMWYVVPEAGVKDKDK